MKMKHITLIAVLFSLLLCNLKASKSKQLFEVVNNEFNSKNNNNNKNNESNNELNSLFSSGEDNSKSNEISFTQKNEQRDEKKSLFEDSGNDQPKGKSLFEDGNDKPEKNSLFDDNKDSQESEMNKVMKKNIRSMNNSQDEKSLFGDDDENNKPQVPGSKSLFGDDNDNISINNKQKEQGKSLFDLGEELVKPQVKLNDNIKAKVNLKAKKTSKAFENDKITNIENKTNPSILQLTGKARKMNNNENQNLNKRVNKKDNNKIKNIKHNTQKYSEKKSSIKSEIKQSIPEKIVDNTMLEESKSEIQKLKSKVYDLISLNKELMTEIEKKQKIKKKSLDLSDDLINLIQTSEAPLKEYKINLTKTQVKSEEKLARKEKQLKEIYTDMRRNLDNLVGNVDSTKKSLNEIKNDESLINGELKKNYITDSLAVLGNVEVEGRANAQAIKAENVDIGNIKIDLEKIAISNPQTEIIVGSEILSLKELVENLEILEKLNDRCGENMKDCLLYNDQLFENDMKRQNQIIMELKRLRKQTKDLIHDRDA